MEGGRRKEERERVGRRMRKKGKEFSEEVTRVKKRRRKKNGTERRAE